MRIFHTHYDHLSHLSFLRQAQNKILAGEEEAQAEAETFSETQKVLENGENEARECAQQEKDDLHSLKSSEGKKVRSVC